MRHMNKWLILTLALLACLSLLVGCGESKKDEYGFKVGEVTLTPGTNAAEPLAALGTPQSYSESGSCGGIEGLDKVYVYGGFTVKTTPGMEESKIVDVINSITLNDDSVSTPEGLRVGSTRDTVVSALGSGAETADALVYSGSTTRLTFSLRDGKVTGIRYTQNAG